jgi:hypothetical protein
MELRVLLIQEPDGRWISQGLDHDIVAQARTLPDVRYEFEKMVVAYMVLADHAGEEPLAHIGPAPQKFWDMYERSDMTIKVERVSMYSSSDRDEKTYRISPPTFKVAESLAAA